MNIDRLNDLYGFLALIPAEYIMLGEPPACGKSVEGFRARSLSGWVNELQRSDLDPNGDGTLEAPAAFLGLTYEQAKLFFNLQPSGTDCTVGMLDRVARMRTDVFDSHPAAMRKEAILCLLVGMIRSRQVDWPAARFCAGMECAA